MRNSPRRTGWCLLAAAAAAAGGLALAGCGSATGSSAAIAIKPVSGPAVAGFPGTTGSPSPLPTAVPAAAAGSTMTAMPSSAATPSTGPAGGPVQADAVVIHNFAFGPQAVMVKAGTTVRWTNNDTEAHTVTSDTGVFNSPVLQPGASYSYTFGKPGTYSYHCSIHPFMIGKVIVK